MVFVFDFCLEPDILDEFCVDFVIKRMYWFV